MKNTTCKNCYHQAPFGNYCPMCGLKYGDEPESKKDASNPLHEIGELITYYRLEDDDGTKIDDPCDICRYENLCSEEVSERCKKEINTNQYYKRD